MLTTTKSASDVWICSLDMCFLRNTHVNWFLTCVDLWRHRLTELA